MKTKCKHNPTRPTSGRRAPRHIATALAAGLVLAVTTACAAPGGDGAPAAKPLRVLAIGNSFSLSICRHLPPAAAACGEQLEFCNLYIGGCSLATHAKNIREGAKNPAFAPYGVTWYKAGKPANPAKFHSNIPQMLATQKWDIVTIQQASHDSWKADTYHPAADQVVETIRRLAPQAEIVVHQTWAYNAADGRISGDNPKWGFNQDGMAERVEAAYVQLAKDFKLRMIPVGLAVKLRRAALAKEGRGFGPDKVKARIEAAKPGQAIGLDGDPVGSIAREKGKGDGAAPVRATGDTIHLNERGKYLQAVTWLGFLFNRDVRDIPYAPNEAPLGAAECSALRAAAQDALDEAMQRGWR